MACPRLAEKFGQGYGDRTTKATNLLLCLFPRRIGRNKSLSLAHGERETWKIVARLDAR